MAQSRGHNMRKGQALVEVMVGLGIAAALMPAIVTSFFAVRGGTAQEQVRMQAVARNRESREVLRALKEDDWQNVSTSGTYHLTASGGVWTLSSGSENGLDGQFTRQIVISDGYRDLSGNLALTGTVDPSVKHITSTVSWTTPIASSVVVDYYLMRLENLAYSQTTVADFTPGLLTATQIVNSSGGEVILANNNYAKWCAPALSSATIDLPDGPPVAVAATAYANTSIPNDTFVATAPSTGTSVKMAYVTVTANTDPPVPTLRGIFTHDGSKYASPYSVPSGTGLDNNFKTNAIKYYTSSGGKTYALIATNLPDKEVIAVLVNDNNPSNDNDSSGEFADPVNHIYKYWTYFNTRIYQGNNASTPNQDQAPFDYGGISLAVFENRGYVASSGFLYTFDLSNIDSKSTSSGLDMIGCRIELDGYDCQPGSGTDRKYSAGQTGTTWSNTTSPAHNDCSDGGNIELYADNDIYPVKSGTSTYIFVAVGAGTNPEFNIANVTTVPTSGTSPKITSSSCGTISSGNSSWKRISSFDFNSKSGTEEAANSVYAKSDGSRAYISSNGGIDGNGDGQPDSYQLYILNTSNKSSPSFLSGTPASGATSGYYYGTGANRQLYPRRSLTVLNGLRAVLVGKDAIVDANNAEEYQVTNISTEATPTYCGGLNFDSGFNDLTSVSEADGDNFVYLVANTSDLELKIIQGGPDVGQYVSEGNFVSAPFTASSTSTFNRFTATVTSPGQTSISMQLGIGPQVNGSCAHTNYTFIGPDPADYTGSYFTPTAGIISGAIPLTTLSNYANPNSCFKYKTIMSTLDNTVTPSLLDLTVNYAP
ncbi:MAG: hypothetical protein WCG44_03055 [bacterium]